MPIFNAMKKPSFQEWVETADWVAAVKASIKNPEELKALARTDVDGLGIKALYRAEDLEHPIAVPPASGTTEIWQRIQIERISRANKRALEALDGGVGGLIFSHTALPTEKDWDRLLDGIHPDWGLPVFWDLADSSTAGVFLWIDYLLRQGYELDKITGGVILDPLTWAARQGKLEGGRSSVFDVLHQTLEYALAEMPNGHWLHVRANFYRESGCSPVQELAFALALASDYMEEMAKRGLDEERLLPTLMFHFSSLSTSDYFTELLKPRAFLLLWKNLLDARSVPFRRPHIHMESGLRNKSVYEAHSNLVRAGIESLAALAGGANSLANHAFDGFFREPDAASYRWARNIGLILRAEAGANQVDDPASGAYFLENRTRQLAEAAWTLFLEIEELGGMADALKSNFIQQQVTLKAEAEKKAFLSRKNILVGSNAYIDEQQKMASEFTRILPAEPEEDLQFLKLRPERLSEGLEVERLKMEMPSPQ
jgi:methylmalonyl-CoA mutase